MVVSSNITFFDDTKRATDLMKSSSSAESLVPLCVDLDGTLIHTDVLWEGIKFLLRRKPLTLLSLLPLLRNGRAPFKKAGCCSIDRESRFIALAKIAGRVAEVRSRRRKAYFPGHCSGRRLFAGSHGTPRILHRRAGKRWRIESESKQEGEQAC